MNNKNNEGAVGNGKGISEALRQFSVGGTPLTETDGSEWGIENLLVKDESVNHFGTFKDRKSLEVANGRYVDCVKYILAITSGNYGFSLSRFLHARGFGTVLIVPKNLDERIAQKLGEFAKLLPLDLDDELLTSEKLEHYAREKLNLEDVDSVVDETNILRRQYSPIFQELHAQLAERNMPLDYLLVPLGGGELFLEALNYFSRPAIKEQIRGRKKVIGITTNNPDSMASMLYAKYRPALYLGYGGLIKEEDAGSFERQMRMIRRRFAPNKQKPKVEYEALCATENEIQEAYGWCIKSGINAEPSAAAAFAALQRYKFKPSDAVIAVNTGNGMGNFVQ